MTIGEKIKFLRTSKGVSQVYIANKLGKTPQWLSNIEKDRRKISISELEQVAEILGVETAIFFDKEINETFNQLPTPDLTNCLDLTGTE
jgi:transcriptional regulator with XRE-family HTH domain